MERRVIFPIQKSDKDKVIERLKTHYNIDKIKITEELGTNKEDIYMIETYIDEALISDFCVEFNVELESTRNMKSIASIYISQSIHTQKYYINGQLYKYENCLRCGEYLEPMNISKEEVDKIIKMVNDLNNENNPINKTWFINVS